MQRFDGFIVILYTDGVETHRYECEGTTFAQVKKRAIASLKAQLEGRHGRGDHSVKIMGAGLMNQTSPQKLSVGFMPEWVLEPMEELFSL